MQGLETVKRIAKIMTGYISLKKEIPKEFVKLFYSMTK